MVRKKSIMRRWTINSMGIISILLVAFGAAFVLSVRYYYFKSVEYSLNTRIERMDPAIDMLKTAKTTINFDTKAREFVENSLDKEKLELQVLNNWGEVMVSSTGFTPDQKTAPDYEKALTNTNNRGTWSGRTSTGEHIMAVTQVLYNADGTTFGGIRYITSLTQIDRQIWIFVGLIVLVSVAVLFFVMMSCSYFVNSIIRPVAEVNQAARRIALGDYDSRIQKKSEDEIGELCDTINYMANEISTAEQMKNNFISSVSHELRTPLTAIKGWAETLEQGGASDVELNEKGLGVIIAEAERLSGIVEELLDFSRMQGGHMVMKFGRIDVLAELSEAVLLFRDRAERESLSLLYIEPESLAPIFGDHERLRQVFINVIDNAIKYSNPGGRIRIETADMGGHIQIVVSDTGVGISKEDLPNIKKKFYKANRTRPGSGIGLALADEIIRRHKGRMELDSEEGVGTTVTITLPIAPPETHALV